MVETDPAMLRTILRNLVGNAIKYSEGGGRVLVGCVRADKILIEVRDNGCGVAATRLSKIFEAFERGGRTDMAEGLGLGLHIVRQTAEALERPVAVRSFEGRGSIFSIAVPIVASPPACGTK